MTSCLLLCSVFYIYLFDLCVVRSQKDVDSEVEKREIEPISLKPEPEKEEGDIEKSSISRPRRSKDNNVVEETETEEDSLPLGWSRHRLVSTVKGQHHQYYIRTSHGKLLRYGLK